jgi:hypothetical protein
MSAKLVFDNEQGERVEVDAAELLHTLVFYADPGTYFGAAIWFDPPTGGFDEDIDDDYQDEYMDRPVPGSAARTVLRDLLAAGLPEAILSPDEEPDDDE